MQYRAQYLKGEAKVEITFSDAIMPYLTQLKGQFTRVVMKNVSSLSSTYSTYSTYSIRITNCSSSSAAPATEQFRSMISAPY